ncbi:Protein kinase [Plasmodium coatneyi]|uniref:Protein kinase n=1 Tax=Plasmodium coatneyi TaxID=208452 RepID=A0A1B1DYZ4_9APIC|nr:Protein kinase [Plasmodium coatneyi]ANQ07994.1 Protein kinase [Plasmodium coatneyi]
MHLKTKIPNFLTPDPDRKTQNCINIKNELIQNMHKIYQQQGEEASSRKGAIQPYHLFDPGDYVDFPPFNRTPDVQNICVELKLKLDVRHADGESDPDSSIFLDINPGGVMSRNQRTFVYQYRSTHPVLDKGLDQLTREQRMKYFTALSHQLAGRSITFQGTTYKLLNVLQTAIYGGVYLAQVVDSTDESSVNKKKAIKILSKHLIELAKDKVQEDPLSEYHYRKCMSGHSNILSCDIIFDDDYYVYMIMPFAVHGDLFEVMKTRSKPFTEQEAKYLFYQILLSIKFLHCRKLALRDISLENILLFENEQNGLIYPVLNDPGQATHFRVNKKNEVTLLEYTKIFGKIFRPPEVYEKCKYDPTRVDMFCVGYILYFCLTKHELFRCTLEKDMHWNMLKSRHYHELLREKKGLHLSEPALDLIFRCLEPNFKMRLEIGEALRHPWFKGNFFPVHRQSLFLPQGDDTMDEGSAPSGGPPSPMYKLSKEIELCAKRKNVAIDHNTSIRFSIYEHVIAPPQGYFSGGNNPSTCLNSTHRREYPPECEPNAEDDHIRGKRAEDTPRWPPPSMATPTRTDLNSIFKGIPHYVGSHPYGSGYHKGTFPTSPTDYLRHNMARGAHFPSVQGIYAKQSAPVRKSPPLVEKAGWIKKYEDSVSTHTCHTNWTEEDKQSSFHNSPQNCSQIREKSKSNFLMRHKKGAYRMIGMKRKKQKLSSDATAEEVDRGDNLFVESSISSLHVMVRQSLQTGAQDDTLKTVQKSPHILTTAEATKGRGLLSIFSERQLPNGGELPKNGTFTKKIDYPIGPFEGRSFIHVEEGHSGWGIMSRKKHPSRVEQKYKWQRNEQIGESERRNDYSTEGH